MEQSQQLEDRVEEIEAPRRRRRRRRRSKSKNRSRSTRILRMAYFGLASIWGFLAGTAAILIFLNVAGTPVSLGPKLAGILLAAAIVSMIGGALLAVAYRQASRR